MVKNYSKAFSFHKIYVFSKRLIYNLKMLRIFMKLRKYVPEKPREGELMKPPLGFVPKCMKPRK